MADTKRTKTLPTNLFDRPSFPGYAIVRNSVRENLREFRDNHRAELEKLTVRSALEQCESSDQNLRRIGVAYLLEENMLEEHWVTIQDHLRNQLRRDDILIKRWILSTRFAARSVTLEWTDAIIDCLKSGDAELTELATNVLGEFKETAILPLVEQLRQSFISTFFRRRNVVDNSFVQRPLAKALRFAVMQFEHDTREWLRHFADDSNLTNNPRAAAFHIDPIRRRRKTTHHALHRLRWSLTNPDPYVSLDLAYSFGMCLANPKRPIRILRDGLNSDVAAIRRSASECLTEMAVCQHGLRLIVAPLFMAFSDTDDAVHKAAVEGLAACGTASTPFLKTALSQPNSKQRERCVKFVLDEYNLQELAPEIARILPEIPIIERERAFRFLLDSDCRFHAIVEDTALTMTAASDPVSIQAGLSGLSRLINSESPTRSVDEILSRARLFADSGGAIQSLAMQILTALEPDLNAQLLRICEGLKHTDDQVRWTSLSGLIALEGKIEIGSAIPSILEFIKHRDHELEAACGILGRLGPEATPALQSLQELIQTNGTFHDLALARAIYTINNDPEILITQARAALRNHGNSHVRWVGCETVSEFGPRAQSALPELLDLIATDDSSLGERAEESLSDIMTSDAIPTLIPYLERGNETLSRAVLSVIHELDSDVAAMLCKKHGLQMELDV